MRTRRSRERRALWAGALAGALGSCTVGPNYERPQAAAPDAFVEVGEGGTVAKPADPALLAMWWESFEDDTLNSLVTRAVASNLDLRIAEARLREARAARGIVAADDLPTVDAAGFYERLRSSENSASFFPPGTSLDRDLYQVGFDAFWEIDVFGGVRRSVEAADADIGAAREDLRDALVTLLAEVGRNYVEVRTFQRRLDLTRANLEAQREGVSLSRSRFDAGLTSELDVKQAETIEATTAAQLPLLETGLRASIHRLGVLLGQAPGSLLEELSVVAPLPPRPPEVAVGLPSELLQRRPDIRRSERELAAATARVGAATADLFPRFSLTGAIGLESADFGDLFESGSGFWRFGPQFRWPIFEAGRIRSNIAVQDARVDAALALYERTVLTSFEEVENALVAYSREQTRRDSLALALESARRALALSQELYTRGLSGYLNVLDAQRNALGAEDSLAQSDRSIVVSLIALYKALGGGWDAEGAEVSARAPVPDGAEVPAEPVAPVATVAPGAE